jgi:hypothetical protein
VFRGASRFQRLPTAKAKSRGVNENLLGMRLKYPEQDACCFELHPHGEQKFLDIERPLKY